MKNAFTVDVEEYFQVSAFENIIDKNDWGSLESRVRCSMDKLLSLMDEASVKGTFFTLGWIAERHPELVKNLAAEGHEIASHGYAHQRASSQTRQEFKEDVSKAKVILEDLIGCEVKGYRAPSFSFNEKNTWVYEVLAETSHTYSSSVYPVKHDHYGMPDAPRFKYQTAEGVWELPLSTLQFGNKNIPIAGGGYFRLYPYFLTHWAIRRHCDSESKPYIFYMHPWEIDSEQPRMHPISAKTKFRHYVNLARVSSRLQTMLSSYEWGSMDEVFFAGE